MNRDQSVLAAEDADGRSWTLLRSTLVSGLIIFALLQPAINLLGHPLGARNRAEAVEIAQQKGWL